MIGAATRSRLFELRHGRGIAQRSAELLERKREVLLREIARRTRLREQLRARVGEQMEAARKLFRVAQVELGLKAIEAAALAQPPVPPIAREDLSVMGVRVPRLTIAAVPYRAHYGAAATSESLDECGAAFSELLPHLIALAQEEIAVERISKGLRKTTKLLNALEKVVLPRIESDIRTIVDGIEEDERDDALRRAVSIAHGHAGA